MPLLNVLGGLRGFITNPDQRYGDGYDPASGTMSAAPQINTGLDLEGAMRRNTELGRQQAMQRSQQGDSGLLGKVFGQGAGGTITDVLGAVSDALLSMNGMQPIYGPKRQRKQMGRALANYLGNTDQGLADIFMSDPQTGLELYKMSHPAAAEPTAEQRNFSYYRGLPDDQRQAYEKYLQLTHPGMMSPLTMGANDTIEMPGAEQGDITATGPNGEKIRFNHQSGQWETMQQGGPTDSPSATFP